MMLANGNGNGIGVENQAASAEQWQPIRGYEESYEVSDQGRVRSVDRVDGQGRHRRGKVLHLYQDRYGYLMADLWRDGSNRACLVHRLAALAFLMTSSESLEVNHRNGHKTDNRVANLEWVTHHDNMLHGFLVLKHQAAPKSVIGVSLDGIITLRFTSTREAGRQGFNQSTVSRCCRGQRHSHKGYRWHYEQTVES